MIGRSVRARARAAALRVTGARGARATRRALGAACAAANPRAQEPKAGGWRLAREARARAHVGTRASAAMKIYTRTGDAGESSLYTGRRAPKDDAVFEALGDVDECNCAVGSARAAVIAEARAQAKGGDADSEAALLAISEELAAVQSCLLDVGSAVATPLGEASEYKAARASFGAGRAERLEALIDAHDAHLPALTTFILPGGGQAGAALHVARGVARRAERHVQALVRNCKIESEVGAYMNRLSDYLFTAARAAAKAAGEKETVYQKPKD